MPGIPTTLLCAAFSVAGLADEPKADTRPYVEIDFSTLPRDGNGEYTITITVYTADKDLTYSTKTTLARKFSPEDKCAATAIHMRNSRFDAEVMNKTKLRVYGRMFNDKLIPATEGKVESPDLKKEELPKVKNPPKA